MAVIALLTPPASPWVPFIGYLAGALTTLSFLPQVIKVFRSKCASDLSLGMLVAFCIGVFLWLLYGVVLWLWPIIVTNLATLILAGAVLALKLHYDARAARRAAKASIAALAEPAGRP